MAAAELSDPFQPRAPQDCGSSPRLPQGRGRLELGCRGMLRSRIAKAPLAVMCYDTDQLLFSSLKGNLVESHSFDWIKLAANVVL